MNTRIQLQAGRSSFPSLVILFGLALLSFNIFAQAPNPPFFTALDGLELDPNPAGRYSLDDATRGLPFTVNTPTPPQITAEQVVTPSTIGNYINTPGMRLILEPGNYGNMTISGTDKEFVLTTGVVIGQLTLLGQRIVVRADPVRTGEMNQLEFQDGATDVLVDGIYQDNATFQGRNQFWSCARVAVINSRIRQPDFSFVAFGNADDIILANNYLETYGSTQTANRFQSVHRLVFVDNFARATGGNGMFRLHSNPTGRGADNLYVARNQFEGPGWMIKPSSNAGAVENWMGAVWVENNNSYWSGGNGWAINVYNTPPADGYASPIVIRNNNTYSASGGFYPSPSDHPWTATIENNTVSGYVAPPVWEHQ